VLLAGFIYMHMILQVCFYFFLDANLVRLAYLKVLIFSQWIQVLGIMEYQILKVSRFAELMVVLRWKRGRNS
jgi:hypothetical protein